MLCKHPSDIGAPIWMLAWLVLGHPISQILDACGPGLLTFHDPDLRCLQGWASKTHVPHLDDRDGKFNTDCLQGWSSVMEWYLGHRRTLEAEVKKYSDPTSEALLPPQFPNMR